MQSIYHRNKIPPKVKAKAVLLYHWGMALRKVEKFIKALGLRGSREAIRQWHCRLSKLVEYVFKSLQEQYVDETKIKGMRRLYYLWLATDKGWYRKACRGIRT
jgi:transposase-like protein